MNNEILLTLCIPTNGIIEWVIPVLESIYNSECDNNTFEVVVVDNGDNIEFKKLMVEWENKFLNLIYRVNNTQMFLNQIEAFKLARGKLIKFVNHRMIFLPGAVQYLIDFSKKYSNHTPGVYFLNGALEKSNVITKYNCFNDYVKGLSFYSSWSAGTAMWKSDFDVMDMTNEYSFLFPHTDMIFSVRDKKEYIIDNTKLLKELPRNVTKKGVYDVFFAFAVEYYGILLDLVRTKDIFPDTLSEIKRKLEKFIAIQYMEYVIMKKTCSYDISGFEKNVCLLCSTKKIKCIAFKLYIQSKIKGVILRK